jgi:succinate dehydrogenase / fumarate reductase cytochrome b subunit
MNWFTSLLTSTIGKKLIMALTGLFLISFLVIHCTINAMIFLNDGGATFSHWGHFMGTNPLIRTLEIGLVIGFLLHIIDGFGLMAKNRGARPVRYAKVEQPNNIKITWYSRSMGLLGTLILIFLVIHTAHFWIPNRMSQGFTNWEHGEIDMYAKMLLIFQEPWVVIVYVLGCFSLFWHLLHGFKSSFQTLGLNHLKYNGLISFIGTAFSIIVPTIFALMPISIYFGWVK